MNETYRHDPAHSRMAPIPLWAPNTIGVLSALLGFPGGFVLACINWQRMGLTRKAITHLLIGGAGTAFLLFYVLESPGYSGNITGALINFMISYYLYRQMQNDIETVLANKHRVRYAGWLTAALVSLAGFFLVVAVLVLGSDLLAILIP